MGDKKPNWYKPKADDPKLEASISTKDLDDYYEAKRKAWELEDEIYWSDFDTD